MRSKLFSLLGIVFFNFYFTQQIFADNFNSHTIGNVSPAISTTTTGQGGWGVNQVGDNTTTVADFQIIAGDATHQNIVQITGTSGVAGSRHCYQPMMAHWATRTTGNDIIQAEVDMYTGSATTSKNQMRMYIFDQTLSKILVGITLFKDTKVIQALGYYNGTSGVGNYRFYLGGGTNDIVLPADSWLRIGIAYNKTTGSFSVKGPGFDLTWQGAAVGEDPLDVEFAVLAGTGNTVSTQNWFDNIIVTAVNSFSLLASKEVDYTSNSELISIYPNPADDFVNINSKYAIQNLALFDLSGKKLETKILDNRIDVSNLLSGTYILTIETEKGKISKKLIKK